MPGAGIEPAREKIPQDFKSYVSTNATTSAHIIKHYKKRERKNQ